ncbi:MAG: carbohydrate ABC transporter permease [Treponema sp.]|jgi:multiple sugar transport system permease protein/putative aldouronate transport system permease protein|nr:carbohydrate ABC transporter permease [Treponema sp.]
MTKLEKTQINPIANVLNIFLIGLYAFTCIYPLWYIAINSVSSSMAIGNGVFLLPVGFNLEAYRQMLDISGLNSAIFISIARTVSGALLSTFCASFMAYIITRRHMLARKFIYRFLIFTMYFSGGFIPTYVLLSALGFRNNFLVYIVPGAISAFNIIMVKTYIESMPASLWESAEIDGAGVMRIYYKLIVPLTMPILACLIVWSAVGQWNSWTDDLFYMLGSKARNLHCLQFMLYRVMQTNAAVALRNNPMSAASGIDVPPEGLRMAMSFITVLPILCVYPFMQRYFTKGIMLGAIKG